MELLKAGLIFGLDLMDHFGWIYRYALFLGDVSAF